MAVATITGADVQDESLTGADIAAGAISSDEIADFGYNSQRAPVELLPGDLGAPVLALRARSPVRDGGDVRRQLRVVGRGLRRIQSRQDVVRRLGAGGSGIARLWDRRRHERRIARHPDSCGPVDRVVDGRSDHRACGHDRGRLVGTAGGGR
jgi:hypothetical protein